MLTDNLKFNSDGLIPAIVQDYRNGRVLMMAYMNRESLDISIKEKRTCFWSRSRKELWRKGETSGNVQEIISISADCDGDTLLIKVKAAGPACHTGETSCFFNEVYASESTIAHESGADFSADALYELIKGRKRDMPEGSYTSYLFEKGDDKILKKVGEECAEVIIAAKNNDNAELVYELSDLAYHALVLMAQKNIPLADIKNELASRHIIDKKIKQEKEQAK